MDTQTPGIGHNEPDALEALKDRASRIVEAANIWLNKVPVIESEDIATKCEDFLGQISAEIKAVESARTEALKPLKDETETINTAHHALHHSGKKSGLLDVCKKLLAAKKTAWLQKKEAERREAERKAEEEALKKMQEAEEAAKKAEAAETVEDVMAAEQAQADADQSVKDFEQVSKSRVTVKGNYSNRASGLRSSWRSEITDFDAALNHYRDHPKVHDVIKHLADADARSPDKRTQDVPGVVFHEDKAAA